MPSVIASGPASCTSAIPAGGSLAPGFIAVKGAANTAPTAFPSLDGGARAVA
ncbi:hypothetical protein GTU99_00055 [Streptomyces sp. PRKS01-65]|nr:hypothetical protein [Streptomyces harenosi]NEY30619.1 hypothetical protein [Streptomyces harenosi]